MLNPLEMFCIFCWSLEKLKVSHKSQILQKSFSQKFPYFDKKKQFSESIYVQCN